MTMTLADAAVAARRNQIPLGVAYTVGSTVMFAGGNAVVKWQLATYPLGEVAFGRTHRRVIRRAITAGLIYRPLPLTSADTLGWFLTLPVERQAKLRAGVTPEREAELLAKLRP